MSLARMAGLSALFLWHGIHPKQEGTPLKDFFDTWKFKILVAVAVFLVGIMAYAGANGRLTAAPQELLGVVLMPFQKVTSALSGGIGSVWEKYTSIDEVMEQNEQLEAENAELRQQIVDYDRIKAENEAYKALARIQDSNTEASYISAFVIGRDPLDEFGGFTLDCGTVNGAAVNDAVISDKGYLIGMVVEADTTSCKVMTILHPSFSAAGVVSRTRENGIINGSTDYAGDGLCVLTNLERATETKMGDQVITTGLGGVFPPDLLVVMIARGQDTIVPHGGTVLQTGDLLVMAARAFEDRENLSLQEVVVERSHKWCGRSLSEISVPRNCLIVMIKRGLDTIIPDGSTRLEAGDVLVAAQSNTAASA